jgi:glycosyltransferase involved in cell wall biosynthesis
MVSWKYSARTDGAHMRIGVVIPLFKQAQFLIECVTSALSQTLMPTGIVIVNDGCPNKSSDTLSRAIAAAWPEQVLYVRQENRGLSGARNTGIRMLLDHWPDIEAILPLDADNSLEEYALETMAARLASEGRSDWVYPDPQGFGTEFKTLRPWPHLNPFRLCFENQCDAACLIKRKVFDAGLFFDETMRDGYEDWEFFLRAVLRGFWGTSAGSVGFNYRIKSNSMVVESQKRHKQIVEQIHGRNHLVPKNLTACEHQYMPRFRFIDEVGHCYDFSDPMLPSERRFDPGYVPPITIFGSAAAFELLKRSGMLRGILFFVQHQVRTHSLRVDLQHRETGFGFEQKLGLGDNPALFAFQSAWLADGRISADNIRSIIFSAPGLAISCREFPIGSNAVDFQRLLRHASAPARGEAESVREPFEIRQASHTSFAQAHQLACGTIYPLTRDDRIDICFVVSWLRSGDIDQCVLKFAAALKRSVDSARLHLLVTDFLVIDFDRAGLSIFDEIVSVAHCEHDQRLQMLASILNSMDIIINAHSLQGYQALPLLPSQVVHRPVCIAYLHVIEVAANEALFGYPYVACEYERDIDCFLVISEQLKDFLINSGVNEERIRIGRNAPVVPPATRERGLLLADHKAARQFCDGTCFELLFVGPLDYQKGVSRLAAFIQHANREELNLRLTIVRSTTMDGEAVNWPAHSVRLVEATGDPATLARYFEDADALILLSRWEGIPLVLLDAMAHGCIVVSTDVGAVGELIADGVNGFLCPSSGSDDIIAKAALERVKTVLLDPSGCREMRRRATETAMNFTWDKVAANLEEFLIRASSSAAF